MLAWIWNIFKKKPIKLCKDCKWKSIDSAPLNKVIMFACDSYDCGWVYDFGWKNEKGELISSATVYGKPKKIHIAHEYWSLEPNPPTK